MHITAAMKPWERTEVKLSSFCRLHIGWKNGQGGALSIAAFRVARTINSHAAWFSLETDAFMGIDNDVTLAVYHEGSDYSFHVSSTGLITLDSELQDIAAETNLSTGDCFAKLNLMASSQCKLPYSYTSLISIPSFADSEVWHASHQVMGVESQSSPWIVSQLGGVTFAHMPPSIIPKSLPIHRCSGVLTLDSCPPAT